MGSLNPEQGSKLLKGKLDISYPSLLQSIPAITVSLEYVTTTVPYRTLQPLPMVIVMI